MARIAGTFAATGQSAQWCSASALVILDFVGTATVAIEVYDPVNANWVAVSSKTADFADKFEGYGATQMRLNCTAHTNDVDYCVFT